jgi:hypothetical protein
LTAVKEDFEPVLISEGTDQAEIVIVEATFGDKHVRFINGYGRQENDTEQNRKEFFNQLDEDIERAKLSESMICIEMDANAKLSAEIIKGDPNEMSSNGKLLHELTTKHNLIVVNATNKCTGVITRSKITSL